MRRQRPGEKTWGEHGKDCQGTARASLLGQAELQQIQDEDGEHNRGAKGCSKSKTLRWTLRIADAQPVSSTWTKDRIDEAAGQECGLVEAGQVLPEPGSCQFIQYPAAVRAGHDIIDDNVAGQSVRVVEAQTGNHGYGHHLRQSTGCSAHRPHVVARFHI